LRIEDTDQKRSSRQSEEAILRALHWLGVSWDEGPDIGGAYGPYRQSERLELYQKHVRDLLTTGHAYWCTCSEERLNALRKKQLVLKQPTKYDGHCRNRSVDEVQKERDAGAAAVIRLKVPHDEVVEFNDYLRGLIRFECNEIDDQVLLKSDGFPTYHLANVVDDHEMAITHVMRGEEWISSTPKHMLMYRFFGWEAPVWCHLPLLRNADKSKVSKRKNPVSLNYFKQAGYLPEVMLNFLGLMAFSFADGREIFSLGDFIEEFDFSRISLGGPVFDLQKMLWLNGRYLREKMNDQDWVRYLTTTLFDSEYLKSIVPLVKERVEKSEDFISYADFFFTASLNIEPSMCLLPERSALESQEILEKLAERIDEQLEFQSDQMHQLLNVFMASNGLKPKELFMPLRLVLTGKKASPPLYETMAVLGKERCRFRIRAAIALLKTLKE